MDFAYSHRPVVRGADKFFSGFPDPYEGIGPQYPQHAPKCESR